MKSVHDCLHLLESRGFLYNITLHPSMVGISPLYRDGSGVNAVDVHELLSDILAAGFLDQRGNAVGVEPRDGEEIVWNSNFFQAAHGMLGHFDPSSIKCLSLAGSHTNCVLRILGQEISHEGDEAICHEGRLNLELLRKKDEAFYRAATNGVNWKVLTKEAAMHLPHLLSMIQRTGNATMQRHEHELQLMRRLHGLWVTESNNTKHVDFLSVKKKVTAGKTVHFKALPHLYTFSLNTGVGGLRFSWMKRRPLSEDTRQAPAVWEPTFGRRSAWRSRVPTSSRGHDMHLPLDHSMLLHVYTQHIHIFFMCQIDILR